MFGYVLPVKCEMKVKDFDAYRAAYCGLCMQLKASYGNVSRLFLNYDLVLVAVLADALSGEAGTVRARACVASPVAKHAMLHGTPGLSLAADALVLLTHQKLCDNIQDEPFPKSVLYRAGQPFSAGPYKKAKQRRPALAAVVEEQMARQRNIEAAKSDSMDEAADPTAKMCEAIFAAAAPDEKNRAILGRLGLFAGQIVYLLDAAEDFDEDAAKGRYNPLVAAGLSKADAVEKVKTRCRMAAGEIALCYNLLEPKRYRDILDNIFFLGLPVGIEAAGTKRSTRRPHGQIESV